MWGCGGCGLVRCDVGARAAAGGGTRVVARGWRVRVPARRARRCRPALAHGSLGACGSLCSPHAHSVVSLRSTTRSPFASRRSLLAGRRLPARWRGLPVVDHAAVAPRFARDRPFRAGAASLRSAAFRAELHMVSAPAGKRGGLRGVAAHPPRFLRWPLAPGGLVARGWLWSHCAGALSLAPGGRSRRRERERAAGAGGRCRRRNPRVRARGSGAVASAFGDPRCHVRTRAKRRFRTHSFHQPPSMAARRRSNTRRRPDQVVPSVRVR